MTPAHRGARVDADPRLKLACAGGGLAVCLAASRPAGPLAAAAIALVATALRCGRGARWPALAFPAGLALAAGTARALLDRDGGTAVTWTVGGATVAASASGLAAAARLLARVAGASAIAFWLASTTPLPRLLAALAWLRVPAPILELLRLTDRYRHVLGEALEAAREARALRLGDAGPRRALVSAGTLVGAVLCRALDQAAATGAAVELRGGDLLAGLSLPARSRAADARFAAVAGAALGAAALLAWGGQW